jgi:hypothetical protein
VQLCSEGKPIGRKVALNGDDPARIAARLTREAWAKTKQLISTGRWSMLLRELLGGRK